MAIIEFFGVLAIMAAIYGQIDQKALNRRTQDALAEA